MVVIHRMPGTERELSRGGKLKYFETSEERISIGTVSH